MWGIQLEPEYFEKYITEYNKKAIYTVQKLGSDSPPTSQINEYFYSERMH